MRDKLRSIVTKGLKRNRMDIHIAAWDGELEAVEQFVNHDEFLASEVDETTYGERNTPLHYAAYRGHVAVCEMLLDHRAARDARNEAGCTPLFLAAQQVCSLHGICASPCLLNHNSRSLPHKF